jgi:hypothetical protein
LAHNAAGTDEADRCGQHGSRHAGLLDAHLLNPEVFDVDGVGGWGSAMSTAQSATPLIDTD